MKVRLQVYRDTMLGTGVFSVGAHSISFMSDVVVTTSGIDVTTIFSVGDFLYTGAGRKYGKIKSIDSATQFTFNNLFPYPIQAGAEFYVPAIGTFDLDLQKEPNISINYQFDDVKDPSKTKGSFSQTFKLPFTNNNNEFFQDWYNVNLDTLVFDTKKEYDASIYVGTISQFDGILQLRNVYQKGKYYEVTVFSKVSGLFSLIGDDSLRDAFKSQDGDSWNESLNHVFDANQMRYSWRGNQTYFVNTDSVSLKDPDYDVQKVMYPISITQDKFFFSDSNDRFLNKNQTELDDNQSNIVDITQFRPSIQIKEMIKIILGKAGLSYTSAFIDSEYFSKIFMTTGGHLESSPTPVKSTSVIASAGGQVIVGYAQDTSWGIMGTEADPLTETEQDEYADPSEDYLLSYVLSPNTTISDSSDCFDNGVFTKRHPTQTILSIKHRINSRKIRRSIEGSTSNICGFTVTYKLRRCNSDGEWNNNIFGSAVILAEASAFLGNPDGYSGTCTTWVKDWHTENIDISDISFGRSFKIVVEVSGFYVYSPSYTEAGLSLGVNCTGFCGDSGEDTCAGGYVFGSTPPSTSQECLSTQITMNYDGYDLLNYGAEVDVPACIDPELKQKDFFKDIIQRFNLIVSANPNNPSNIIIEPYDTYLGSGTIRYWTDKLDLSKETIVKDTSSLQKKRIFFTDKEDNDLYNKEIKERHEWANVYGNLEITETNNKWAKGELKNEPMFSPYINGWILKSSSSQQAYQTEDPSGTDLHNMVVQYETTYEIEDDEIDIKSTKTNPKLFWYNGLPTDIRNNSGTAKTIYMHSYSLAGWVAHSFTYYPLCSPYELTPDASDDETEIVATTKSLYWDSWATPFVPDARVFKWSESTPDNWNYTLYGYYWHSYLVSLHHPESRLMDCYLNLDAVDIFNFDFNDEIFIKDSYWRILKIHNYQVGVKTSTKVTLIKVVDTQIGSDCGWSISSEGLFDDLYLTWCPNTDTDCSNPTIWIPQDCCYSRGGTPELSATSAAAALGLSNGELPCKAYQGSLPISKKILSTRTNIRNIPKIRSMGNKALLSSVDNFSVGSGKTKGSLPIMMPIKDDISIKYTRDLSDGNNIAFRGESHRIVLTGQTIGNTTAYAYPEGASGNPSIALPNNSNVIIKVKAINTVVGGTNATYPVGTTEAFGYHTAFKMLNNTGSQIGAAGGVQEFGISDGTLRGSIGISLDTTAGQENRVLFGLIDGQANTIRVWSLTVDFSIQIIPSLSLPLDTNFAEWQDSSNIHLQNRRSLLWN